MSAAGVLYVSLNMYVRFQTKIPAPESGRPTGILVAAHHLRDSNDISIADESWLRDELKVFNSKLPIPECLNDYVNRRAISWFIDTSPLVDHIWNIIPILEQYGIHIDILRTSSPGTIIYEDQHQAVAKPYRKKST